MRKVFQLVGFLAFTAGLLLAIVAGLVAPSSATVILALAVLGTIDERIEAHEALLKAGMVIAECCIMFGVDEENVFPE